VIDPLPKAEHIADANWTVNERVLFDVDDRDRVRIGVNDRFGGDLGIAKNA
jgi:hypothetical protein